MSNFTRNITKRMRDVREEMESKFTNIYWIGDFDAKLREIKHSDADRVPSLKARLAEMINAVGLNCDGSADKNIDYFSERVDILRKDPENYGLHNSTKQVTEEVLQAISEIYGDFPSPGEFIERVVAALDPTADTKDTLRLRLLKRFIKTVNVPENKHYYSAELAKKKNVSEEDFSLLESAGGVAHILKAYYYIKNYCGFIKLTDAETEAIADTLTDNAKKAYLASGKGILEFLSGYGKELEDIIQSDRAEGFCKLISRSKRAYLKRAEAENEEAEYNKILADCDVLDRRQKNHVHDAGKKPRSLNLLKCCDALANGRFLSAASVKEMLFLFAFAYDMRYYFDSDTDYDVNRDVERNLFLDYYCDNLSRYLTDSNCGGNGANVSEPSGHGLSFKNFVDVVFIYCLNKQDMPIGEKVTLFYELLARVKNEYLCPNGTKRDYEEEAKVDFEEKQTEAFQTYFEKYAIKMNADKFCTYVAQAYYCDTREEIVTVPKTETGDEVRVEINRGEFEIDFARSAPLEVYNSIKSKIEKELGLPKGVHLQNIDLRTIPDFKSTEANEDIAECTANAEDTFKLAKLIERDDYYVAAVVTLLDENLPELPDTANGKKLDNGLVAVISEIKKRLKPSTLIDVDEKEEVTRTKIIAAYYHLYCLQCDLDNEYCNVTHSTFKENYISLKSTLDNYLKDAGFQPTSEKNIFDMLVALFAYCRINNRLGEDGI